MINSLATSTPPISSTRTSISCLVTSNISLSIGVLPGSHCGLSLLAPMTLTVNLVPAFNAIISAFFSSALNNPVATLHHTQITTFNFYIIFQLKKNF